MASAVPPLSGTPGSPCSPPDNALFAATLSAMVIPAVLLQATCGSLLNLTPAAQQTLSFAYDSYVDPVRGLGARKWGEKFIKLSATDEGAESGFLDWYLEQFEIPSTEGLCDYGDMICRKDADAHLVMKGVKVPMLLLTPKNSALVPLEDQLLLVKAAGAKMEVIPGYGHEIYLDQREACQDAYLRFLGEVGKK